jgi:uncharacterized membrane protein YvbJ
MKICPNCKKQYADDVAFCLNDGTVLEIPEKVSEAKTIALPAEEVPHVAETVDRVGTSVAQNFARDTESSGLVAETVSDRMSPALMSRTDDAAVADYTENPLFGWLVPLIIVLVLIILGYMFCSKPAAPAAFVSIIINN